MIRKHRVIFFTLTALLLLPAVSATTCAAAPASAAPAAPTLKAVADSMRSQRLRGAGSYQRLMAEADSLLKLRGGSHAEDAQLYLAWNAPWGMKRSLGTRTPAARDTSGADTLYLSFYPGRPSSGFMGFSGELQFRATGPDTLGAWWHMESKGGENGGNILVEFGPSETLPGRQPWVTAGQGFAIIDRTPTSMRLRALFAVSVNDAAPIAPDTTYTLCRVIIRHHRATRLAGYGQPVCVEWTSGKFGFALKDEPEVRRGERFVGYGGGAAVCDVSRGPRVQVWKPKAPAGSK